MARCGSGGRVSGAPLGDVEPVGDVARLGGSAVGGSHRRADPVALAFERVGGEADPPAPLRFVEALPVHGHTELPHAAQRSEHQVEPGLVLVGRRQGRDRVPGPVDRPRRLARERGQRPSRADLDEEEVVLAEHRGLGKGAQAVFEADGRSELRAPVARSRRLGSRPRAGLRRDVRHQRLGQADGAHDPLELLQDRIHHRRVERVRRVEEARHDGT